MKIKISQQALALMAAAPAFAADLRVTSGLGQVKALEQAVAEADLAAVNTRLRDNGK